MKSYTVTKSFEGSPDGNKRWAFTEGEVIMETDSRLSDVLVSNAVKQGVFTEADVEVTTPVVLGAGGIILTEPATSKSTPKASKK